MTLEIKIDRMKQVLKAMDSLAFSSVLVGVPEKTTEERDDKQINNGTLAAIHEYGAPKAGIPARPFLVPGIEKAKEQCANYLREGAEAVLENDNPNAALQALNKAGLHAAKEVQKQFTDNNWKELEDSTIAARKKTRKMEKRYKNYKESNDRKDIKGDYKPLIDTGALRASITYEIRKTD